MNPTTQDVLDKEAVAVFLAVRARKSGGVFSAIRGKALEILKMLPAGSLMPDPIPPAVEVNKGSKTPSSAAGYACLIRTQEFTKYITYC